MQWGLKPDYANSFSLLFSTVPPPGLCQFWLLHIPWHYGQGYFCAYICSNLYINIALFLLFCTINVVKKLQGGVVWWLELPCASYCTIGHDVPFCSSLYRGVSTDASCPAYTKPIRSSSLSWHLCSLPCTSCYERVHHGIEVESRRTLWQRWRDLCRVQICYCILMVANHLY